MKSCKNCVYRAYESMFGIDYCLDYEMASTEAEEIKAASECSRYEEGTPECLEDRHYCKSSTGGDYSPSCPWNAEGMSIRDFI